jgi:OOP family OmpA-OmpF porin
MNTRIPQALVATALLVGVAAGAHAEGAYVGAAIGQPDYRTPAAGVGGHDGGNGIAAKIDGGYQFTPNFAVEGGYFNLGRSKNIGGGDAKVQGGYADAVGSVEFAPHWSLLGSAGLAEGRFETPSGKDWSPAVKLGVGLQYDVSRSMAVRLGYDHYHFTNAFDDKTNVGATMLGLKFGF